MSDISVFGLRINVTASVTFPAGFTLTQFADDADPIDVPSVQLADKAVGVNGDLVTWSKANPLVVTVNVLPGGEDDKNLAVLAGANRAAAGRRPALDVITMTVIMPDGSQERYVRGAITDAVLGRPGASSGRQKTKAYAFAFEDRA